MIDIATIEADVTFRHERDGGRSAPLADGALSGGTYRPHIVIGDPSQRHAVLNDNRIEEAYLGVVFTAGPTKVATGVPLRVQMNLLFWPNPACNDVVPGATFTVREGPRIVGHGMVIRRWTESRDA